MRLGAAGCSWVRLGAVLVRLSSRGRAALRSVVPHIAPALIADGIAPCDAPLPSPPQVTAHYDLMADFTIKVPELHQAAYHTMEADYVALRDAQWYADSNRDATVQRFKADLEGQVEALNTEVGGRRLGSRAWLGVCLSQQGRGRVGVLNTEGRPGGGDL